MMVDGFSWSTYFLLALGLLAIANGLISGLRVLRRICRNTYLNRTRKVSRGLMVVVYVLLKVAVTGYEILRLLLTAMVRRS